MYSLKINLLTSPVACQMQVRPTQFRWLEGVVCKVNEGVAMIDDRDDKNFGYSSATHGTIGNMPQFTSKIPTC